MMKLALPTIMAMFLAMLTAGADKPAPPADPAEALLDRIEHRAAEIKTVAATLKYDRIQGLLGDKQRRFGTLQFTAGPPGRFAIHFDKLLVDNRLDKQDRWFIFDGVWLVERLDDKKQFIKRQIVPPDTKPEDADPLGLGQGPFPLPIRARKADILARFHAAVIAPDEKSDPKDVATTHLRLTPKAGRPSDFTRIDLWYDNTTLLPVRTQTLDDSENQSVIDLRAVKVNEPIEDTVFDTAPPKDAGWLIEIKPWERGAKGAGSS